MNKLPAKIIDVNSSGGVTLVDIQVNNLLMSALLIEAHEKPKWLQKDNHLLAIFKETEVSIAKDFVGKISTRNKIPCKVTRIEKGELMSLITMQFDEIILRSAITTRAVDSLDLMLGDQVVALIKSNEVTLMEI